MELALWSEFHTRTDCIHMRRFSWPEAQLEKQQYRENPRCRPFDGSGAQEYASLPRGTKPRTLPGGEEGRGARLLTRGHVSVR